MTTQKRLFHDQARDCIWRGFDALADAVGVTLRMIQEGLRYLAGGMNPMDLKRGIEEGVVAVVAELARVARPCADSNEIAHAASISAPHADAVH